MDEQLHTFLFADISGYAILSEFGGDEFAADVALGFAAQVEQMADDLDAEIVNVVGDGVMVHCADAAEAIRLGMRLQTELGTAPGDQPFPPIHVGIHTGPALERAGGWWGMTVIVAARVGAAAGAGELLITEASKRAAAGGLRTTLRNLGLLRLKNISSPVCVYAPSRADRSLEMAGALLAC